MLLRLLEHLARVGHAGHRAACDADVRARDLLNPLLRLEGLIDPSLVEAERALRHALVAIARVKHAGVAAVE